MCVFGVRVPAWAAIVCSIYRKAIRIVWTFFCSSEWTTNFEVFFLAQAAHWLYQHIRVHSFPSFFSTKEIPSAFCKKTPLFFNLWLLSLFLSKVKHVINWITIWKPKKEQILSKFYLFSHFISENELLIVIENLVEFELKLETSKRHFNNFFLYFRVNFRCLPSL